MKENRRTKRPRPIRPPCAALFLVVFLGWISPGSSNTYAAPWSTPIHHWAESYNPSPKRFATGNVATVWGAIRRKLGTFFQRVPTEISLSMREFARGEVPVGILLQEKDGLPVRAPLAVFLTGVFGTNQDPVALTMVRHLRLAGYHVLALNNPWSVTYREARPIDPPGSLESEARVVLQLIEKARSRIGPSLIQSTRLVGVSYGGFLAHVTLAIDHRSSKPLIDHGLLALSPPLDLHFALAQMDIGIARARALEPTCAGWSKIRDILQYAWFESEDDLSTQTRKCADHLLFSDFEAKLARTAQVLKSEGSLKETVPAADTERNITFQSFTTGLAQRADVRTPIRTAAATKLVHWLEQLPLDRRKSDIQILSSADDFVNPPKAWHDPTLTRLVPTANLLLLNWGGHFGYTDQPEFHMLLQNALAPAHP